MRAYKRVCDKELKKQLAMNDGNKGKMKIIIRINAG
jgi:hypothetical protein